MIDRNNKLIKIYQNKYIFIYKEEKWLKSIYI